MSKTYFGRCAAVGIAGLTAMSSLAIVASAATQSSMLYELKYNGIESICMKGTTTYGNGNLYCNPVTRADDVMMDGGFVTTLVDLVSLTSSYDTISNGNPTPTLLNAGDIWSYSYFTNITSFDTNKWVYKSIGELASMTPGIVKVVDPYTARTGVTNAKTYVFMNESDRKAAKQTMTSKIQSEYTAVATKANKQFSDDINSVKNAILKDAKDARDTVIKGANTTYNSFVQSNPGADAATLAAQARLRDDAVQTATNKYNAIESAINTSAAKIISEFSQTFNSNNFVYDYKSGNPVNDTFGEAKCPVQYTGNIGGLAGAGTASYTSVLGTTLSLTTAMYNAGGYVYNTPSDFVLKGELQIYSDITGAGSQLVGNGRWINYQVIDNDTNSGGNTSPSGGNTTTGNTTTTVTTWYPDSAAYRAASEVSYRGENGYWYTSASAASTYGGGYTGTSKNSNFSSVNTGNTNGKAIYFDSTTGTYSTSSSSYSYMVKEATSASNTINDPYYTYFFGNKNNITTTAPAGSPAISGASKYAGWTNISAYITNRGKSGATYTINMNEGTVVPSAVLAAAKAKNVTLVFANKNGSKVTVKPGKVSTGSDLNVAVTYNVKDVKTSLVNKAKKVNPGTVSTAQVRVGSEGSIGGTETVTVKFSTKRAGCTVKAYRLTASGSLKKEATGTVSSTGRVNLNLKNGGSYLLVVVD